MSEKRTSAIATALLAPGRPPPDFRSAIRHLAAAQMDCCIAVLQMKIALDKAEDGDWVTARKDSQEGFDRAVEAYQRAKRALDDIGDD